MFAHNGHRPESASSSPTKSPKAASLFPSSTGFNFGAPTFIPKASPLHSPLKSPPLQAAAEESPQLHVPNSSPSFNQHAFAGQTTFSPPSDEFPNLGDTSEATSANSGWQIPAVRPEEPSFAPPAPQQEQQEVTQQRSKPSIAQPAAVAAPSSRALASPHKQGAAAKVGRREAWLKFMAYEGAVQICLDSMLKGTATPATGFLLDGCRDLKEALSLGMLLIPAAQHGQGTETAIYWDDREESGGAVLERIAVQEPIHTYDNPLSKQAKPRALPRRQETPPAPPPAPPASVRASLMTPLRNAQQSNSATTVGPRRGPSQESLVPMIEATVVRVVACPFLTTTDGRRSRSSSARKLAVVMHPTGVPNPEDSRSWTRVTPSGATEASGVLRLLPDAPRGTVLVELYSNDKQVAAGTVQAAELQRCALQHDSLDDEAPMAAGFLRNLMPAFGRRKDSQGQGTSSLTWVRLVDSDGVDAGHVVVAAKVVTASEASVSVGHHPSSPTFTSGTVATPPPPPSAPPPSTAAAAMLAAKSPQDEEDDSDREQRRGPRGRQRSDRHGEGGNIPSHHHVVRVDVRGAGVGGRAHTSGGYLHVNAQHVYDVLLEAALKAAGCGPASLTLAGPWSWLVQQHAERYGVRRQYAVLAHLRWVVRTDNAAPTAVCLETIAAELGPVLNERDSVALASAELALLGHVLDRVDQLLHACFENYFALSEKAAGGLADGMLSVRGSGAPPALRPAIELLEMTRGTDSGPDGGSTWLVQRLKYAARKRFQALLAATEARRGPNSDRRRGGPALTGAAGNNEADDPEMAWAFSRVEELCACVINELRADESIAASGVLPSDVTLPGITSVEYIRGTIQYLHHVLERFPPSAPSPAAVRLVESVGRLQTFVERHGFDDAATRLNSSEIFGGFVAEWIVSTGAGLRRTLRALDRAGPPALLGWADLQTGVKTRVSPLVEGMLSEVEAEMRRYARIVAYWPAHGQDLEAALVSVLREATAAASGQCGLVQRKVDDAEPKPVAAAGKGSQQPMYMHRPGGKGQAAMPEGKRFGRVAWRWVQVGAGGQSPELADAPAALRGGINLHQALLLNSLRRLLAVVPQLELALRGWCAGTGAGADPRQSSAAPPKAGGLTSADRCARDAPDLGAHWAQLVKEIRTEYYACCTLTVESLAGELARASATSVIGVLRREALTAAPAALSKQMRKVLDQTQPNLRWLAAALDGRVYVALARGLWDNAAKDVLRFAEDLTDGGVTGAAQGAWRARQCASASLKALDTFYRNELANAMGSDLLDRDLTPPQHAQRASALLADNTVEVNMSFDVY